MRLGIVLVIAGCWTGPDPVAPAPPRTIPAHVEAPPPARVTPWSPRAEHTSVTVGDADLGCQLMIDKGCARCHHRGNDPHTFPRRRQLGVDGMRRALADHIAHSPSIIIGTVAVDEAEDLVTCMNERWF